MQMPRRELFAKLGVLGGLMALAGSAQAQDAPPKREFLKSDFAQGNAYSFAAVA